MSLKMLMCTGLKCLPKEEKIRLHVQRTCTRSYSFFFYKERISSSPNLHGLIVPTRKRGRKHLHDSGYTG